MEHQTNHYLKFFLCLGILRILIWMQKDAIISRSNAKTITVCRVLYPTTDVQGEGWWRARVDL